MTAGRGELIVRVQFANPDKHQSSFFESDELHPAKADSRVTAAVVCVDDLIGGQRYGESLVKKNERAGRPVLNDRKRRHPVALPAERGRADEVDQ